jgi:hypothetical protein
MAHLVLGVFHPTDAAHLCSVVAAQLDARFVRMDLRDGSRILWPAVAADMSAAAGRAWSEAQCQRLWRYCAYGEDVGERDGVLPDSDGEDEPAGATPAQLATLPLPSRADAAAAAARVTDRLARGAAAAAAAAAAGGNAPEGAGAAASESDAALVVGLPEVAAAALPPALAAAVDAAVRQALGAAPQPARTAMQLFEAHYTPDAQQLTTRRDAQNRARVSAAQWRVAAGGDPKAAEEEVAAMVAAMQRDAAEMTWEAVLQKAWSAGGPAMRAEFSARAADDARRWAAAAREYRERYAQLYRLVALHPAVLGVSGRGGGVGGSGSGGVGAGVAGAAAPAVDVARAGEPAGAAERELLLRAAVSASVGRAVSAAEAAAAGWVPPRAPPAGVQQLLASLTEAPPAPQQGSGSGSAAAAATAAAAAVSPPPQAEGGPRAPAQAPAPAPAGSGADLDVPMS